MSAMLALAQLSPEELRKEIIHVWSAGQKVVVDLSLFGIDLSITRAVIYMWVGAAITFLLLFVGARLLRNRPGAYQVVVEEIYGFGRNKLGGQMGEEGKKWFPYTLTIFVFLLVLNLFGLVPEVFPVTSSISFTMTLAILTFVLVQIEGIRYNGVGHYFAAFVPPGMPAKPIMVPFMLFIEIISEIAKPLTLGMRLYANMLAGHLLIFIFLSFILYAGGFTTIIGSVMPLFSIPAGLVLYSFEIFVSVLQAYIFAILTQVYIEIAIYRREH